jgi:DNA-binding GntR family transcriptional regulator
MHAELSSQDRAYQFLKAAILDLEYRPNQRLTAQEIAERLNVSRTPVREALGRLEQEGLVARTEGWGYTVRSVTIKETMDLYKVREALEVEAIKEALPNVDERLILALTGFLDRAERSIKAGKPGEFRHNTRMFYRSIAKATRNSYLELMLSLIDDRIRWLGALIADKYFDRPRESLSDNRELLRALTTGDEAAAVAAIRKHVAGARQRFMGCVTSDNNVLVSV